MAPISEDSEDSLSKPMSLRYLPPPSPALSVTSYAHQGYIPDRYPRPDTVHADRPAQDQHAFDLPFLHDYRANTMGHNHERPQATLTPRPGLTRAHPDSPGSPMQLDFILNDPKPLSPSSPSPLQTTQAQGSDSPSPRKPKPKPQPECTRPQQPDRTKQDEKSSPPLPQPQPQDTKPAHGTRSTTARQTITKFEAITAHTAKCDLCNRRNDAGMSRCLSCGWQSCHNCTLKNGCTRSHKAGSRAHTGPIDSRELASGASGGAGAGTASRGRKKTRGRGKSRGRGGGPSRSRMGREGEDRGHDRDRDDSPATLVDVDAGVGHVSSPVEQVFSSPSGMDSSQRRDSMMVEGARNLYAFSLEAYMRWTQEQKEKGNEDPGSGWGAFAGIEDIHSYAQEEATRAFGQYSQNR